MIGKQKRLENWSITLKWAQIWAKQKEDSFVLVRTCEHVQTHILFSMIGYKYILYTLNELIYETM